MGSRQFAALARAVGLGLALVVVATSMLARGPASAGPNPLQLEAPAHAAPVSHRSCGLRLDGTGPDFRCGRYEQACLRNRQDPGLCTDRREACVHCAVAFRVCEERNGHPAGLLVSCERCIEDFKRCTRTYERRLPLRFG